MIIMNLVIDSLFLLLLIQLQTPVRDLFTRYVTQVDFHVFSQL